MTVTQHARQVPTFNQFVQQLGRERVGLASEITPVEQHGQAGDFPVAARRVLAARHLCRMAIGTDNLDIGVNAGREVAGTLSARVEQAHLREIR